MFYKPKTCIYCKHKTYPIKDENGLIWQNLLKIDIMSLLLVIGLVLMLYGFSEINKRCYDIVENPCKFLSNLSCNSFGVISPSDYSIKEVPNYVFPQNLSAGITG